MFDIICVEQILDPDIKSQPVADQPMAEQVEGDIALAGYLTIGRRGFLLFRNR